MDYMEGVAPLKTGKSTQVAIRIEDELLARLEALVTKLSPPGMALPRSEVLRAALAKGLEVLEGGKPASESPKVDLSRVRFELKQISNIAAQAMNTCRAANKSNKTAAEIADDLQSLSARVAHTIEILPTE